MNWAFLLYDFINFKNELRKIRVLKWKRDAIARTIHTNVSCF